MQPIHTFVSSPSKEVVSEPKEGKIMVVGYKLNEGGMDSLGANHRGKSSHARQGLWVLTKGWKRADRACVPATFTAGLPTAPLTHTRPRNAAASC